MSRAAMQATYRWEERAGTSATSESLLLVALAGCIESNTKRDGGFMAIESVRAADCRLWHGHARGDLLDEVSCAPLIDSIRTNGQRIPALGRRCGSAEEASIELIYGARRLFAAQVLGLELLVD